MKKKILLLFLILLILPLLTGCLSKQTSPEKKETKGQIIAKKVESLPEDLSNFVFDTHYLIPQNCETIQGLSAYDFQFNAASIDLDEDGELEYIIEPYEVCGQMIRGASGNGPYTLYQKMGSDWGEIGVLEGNGYTILKERTNGYHDIQTAWHDSASSYYVSLYQAEKDETLGAWYKLIKKELTAPQRD